MFDGATKGAKRSGVLGLVAFTVGTLLIGLYVSFFQDSFREDMLGLLLLWLVVVGARVIPAKREGELSAFSDVMKWQIAIAAAAAAVVAPLGLNSEGQLASGFEGPVYLFLISSGCAAVGYALLREAEQQLKDKARAEEREESARLAGSVMAGAVDRRLMNEVDELRGEIERLKQPWWRRLGRK